MDHPPYLGSGRQGRLPLAVTVSSSSTHMKMPKSPTFICTCKQPSLSMRAVHMEASVRTSLWDHRAPIQRWVQGRFEDLTHMIILILWSKAYKFWPTKIRVQSIRWSNSFKLIWGYVNRWLCQWAWSIQVDHQVGPSSAHGRAPKRKRYTPGDLPIKSNIKWCSIAITFRPRT